MNDTRTREEIEQSEKRRAEQRREYGCDLCPTTDDCPECLNEDAYERENIALEQKMMHERQWDAELDRKLKEEP